MAGSSDHSACSAFDVVREVQKQEEFKLDSRTNQLVLSNVDILLSLTGTEKINFEAFISNIQSKASLHHDHHAVTVPFYRSSCY